MNKGLKKLLSIVGVGLVSAVFLRIIQIFFVSESSTGFFIKGLENIGNIITASIFLIIGVCTIYGAVYREKEASVPSVTRSFGIIHFMLAAAIVYESLFSSVSADTQAWKVLLQMVFGLTAALLFALRGYRAFTGEPTKEIISVAFVLFWLIRVIITFSSNFSSSVITENIFEMLALCTALIFFFNASAFENGVAVERRAKVMLPSCIVAALSGAVYSVSQLVVIISGNRGLLHTQNASFITNLVLVFYILWYAVLCFKEKKEEAVVEQIEEQPEEQTEEQIEEI